MVHSFTKTLVFCLLFFGLSIQAFSNDLVLVGKIPGEYFSGKDKNQFFLGYVHIEDREIKKVSAIEERDVNNLSKEFPSTQLIILKNQKSGEFDAIYPGLIDLHNHAKSNMLPVWEHAHGQFSNRFEWRGESSYEYSVSANVNLWLNVDSMITCAAYRWNELQAMTLGTTYLQGSRACDDNFSIHRVEDVSVFKNSDKSEVSAPTDLIMPADMVFVWNTLKPLMDKKGYNYEQAMTEVITQNCPGIDFINESYIREAGKAYELINGRTTFSTDVIGVDEDGNEYNEDQDFLSLISNRQWLESRCNADNLPDKFIRYVYYVHKTVASKKNFLDDPKHSAYIVHLSEGRRDDPYNQIEFQIAQLLGLTRKNVSFVHGLGISKDELKYMANLGMGLIWSPYSNLLLYGQTLDFGSIQQAEEESGKKLPLALGSDWTPTGTKSVLEELKLARQYMKKTGLDKTYDDEALFNMVTTGPAKIINHEGEVGTLKESAMGSIIVTSVLNSNPYTNIVADVWERDINLVVIDGKPIYGNQSYINSVHKGGTEDISLYVGSMSDWVNDQGAFKFDDIVKPPVKFERSDDKDLYVVELSSWVANNKDKFENSLDACSFDEPKLFVNQESGNSSVNDFKETTGLNLDRMFDIQALMAVGLMTQSRNIHDSSRGKLDFRAKYFPHLLTCADSYQKNRLVNFVKADSSDDEFTRNLENASRAQNECEKYGICSKD